MCSACLRALLGVVLLLASPALAGARELRVCADPNNMPFSNERQEGFENRIAQLVAKELDADLTYVWWAQRRGFIRNTLKAGLCDLVPGVMAGLEMLRTTRPYYRSTYVFAWRSYSGLDITSFDDPKLRELKIGVQLIGDDGANTPPAHALTKRGIVENVRGYTLYGDYGMPDPAGAVMEALARGEIDVAIAWGPFAGFFAARHPGALTLRAVTPAIDRPFIPMVYDIGMGVRREDTALRGEVQAALLARRRDIDAILASYGVPRLDGPGAQP